LLLRSIAIPLTELSVSFVRFRAPFKAVAVEFQMNNY
jgi:hypothetical protein